MENWEAKKMSALSKKKTYTPDEYLILERKAEEKSEYHDGKIVSRASSDINHITLMMNVACELHGKLKAKGFRILMSDMKVRTPDSRYFLYPDVLIYRSKPKFHDEETDVILNPQVVVEIVSKETTAFDHSDKFCIYREFNSLNEYVLIDQNQILVESYSRQIDNSWAIKSFTENEMRFLSIGTTLEMSEIYDSIEFEENL
jgi:Uma2 family endonuclease